MKVLNLVIISSLISINLYGSELENKIDELCKIKASVFTSERLYKHEYGVCSKKLLGKKLSLSELNSMIENEDSAEDKRKKIKERIENSKKLKTEIESQKKKYASDTSQAFNINYETCFMIGVAYGVCATRSMNDIACEEGTDFVMPNRCKGKTETREGMKSGIALQRSLINQGAYR